MRLRGLRWLSWWCSWSCWCLLLWGCWLSRLCWLCGLSSWSWCRWLLRLLRLLGLGRWGWLSGLSRLGWLGWLLLRLLLRLRHHWRLGWLLSWLLRLLHRLLLWLLRLLLWLLRLLRLLLLLLLSSPGWLKLTIDALVLLRTVASACTVGCICDRTECEMVGACVLCLVVALPSALVRSAGRAQEHVVKADVRCRAEACCSHWRLLKLLDEALVGGVELGLQLHGALLDGWALSLLCGLPLSNRLTCLLLWLWLTRLRLWLSWLLSCCWWCPWAGCRGSCWQCLDGRVELAVVIVSRRTNLGQ